MDESILASWEASLELAFPGDQTDIQRAVELNRYVTDTTLTEDDRERIIESLLDRIDWNAFSVEGRDFICTTLIAHSLHHPLPEAFMEMVAQRFAQPKPVGKFLARCLMRDLTQIEESNLYAILKAMPDLADLIFEGLPGGFGMPMRSDLPARCYQEGLGLHSVEALLADTAQKHGVDLADLKSIIAGWEGTLDEAAEALHLTQR